MQPQSAIDVERALARLAANQHGVVSLAQMRAVGLGKEAVKARARRGRLHRVHRGVYAVGHPRLTNEGRWMAAVLAPWRQVIDRPDEVVAAVRARLVPCLPSSAAVRR